MEEARRKVEEWLTQTLHRDLYEDTDVAARLNELTELITDQNSQEILINWKNSLGKESYYSASLVMDHLLELWGHVNHACQNETSSI